MFLIYIYICIHIYIKWYIHLAVMTLFDTNLLAEGGSTLYFVLRMKPCH